MASTNATHTSNRQAWASKMQQILPSSKQILRSFGTFTATDTWLTEIFNQTKDFTSWRIGRIPISKATTSSSLPMLINNSRKLALMKPKSLKYMVKSSDFNAIFAMRLKLSQTSSSNLILRLMKLRKCPFARSAEMSRDQISYYSAMESIWTKKQKSRDFCTRSSTTKLKKPLL